MALSTFRSSRGWIAAVVIAALMSVLVATAPAGADDTPVLDLRDWPSDVTIAYGETVIIELTVPLPSEFPVFDYLTVRRTGSATFNGPTVIGPKCAGGDFPPLDCITCFGSCIALPGDHEVTLRYTMKANTFLGTQTITVESDYIDPVPQVSLETIGPVTGVAQFSNEECATLDRFASLFGVTRLELLSASMDILLEIVTHPDYVPVPWRIPPQGEGPCLVELAWSTEQWPDIHTWISLRHGGNPNNIAYSTGVFAIELIQMLFRPA